MVRNQNNKVEKSANSKAEEKKHFKIKYIVPPGLGSDFVDFQDHYKVAKDTPIMIVGPTGVGKSLFLNIFTKLFEEEQLKEGKEPKIRWTNCAHFGGVNSDPNIARSELFGHLKNSFGGANKDKKGLVEDADGGALILEEIGELPLEVQAMLLTFIETGEFRKVGGSSYDVAKVRIVGATNRESALREDFRYRFFPFYLPPLRERRKDILYYMHSKYPELTLSLTRSEVLVLLAYHWPGNVREIDRVAKLMLRSKISSETFEFNSPKDRRIFELGRLHRIDERYSGIKGFLTDMIHNGVSNWGGDVKLLESLLKPFRIGLSKNHTSPVFKDVPKFFQYLVLDEAKNRFGVDLLPPIIPFEDAFRGFLAFCGLFMQDSLKNKNILESLEEADWEHLDLQYLEYSKSNEKRVDKLEKLCLSRPKWAETGY